MSLPEQTVDGSGETNGLWHPADLEGLRARYRAERDRRLRPEGTGQFGSTLPGSAFADYARDPWSPVTPREPVTGDVDVAVVGAGFGGLTTAAQLRRSGIASIRMIDTAGDVGGTWYWNRYPGVACDIESYIYLPLLEEVGAMPTRRYSPGEEIRRHAVTLARHFDLYRDTLFHTEVTAVRWLDEEDRWQIGTDRGDSFRARYVVLSGGPFSAPRLPGIPGIDRFAGHAFHTSRWDYGCTGGGPGDPRLDRLAGKRVAVIGTGATAVQVVPALAGQAGHLYVVQRTPSGVDVRDDGPTDESWWASLRPGWQKERRENFQALVHGAGAEEDLIGDAWTDTAPVRGTARLAAAAGAEDPALAMELADHQKMAEIRARVTDIVEDPETAAALQPWYRQFCKRPAFSDRYLQAFNSDRVELVDTRGRGVDEVTEKGIVVDGTEYPVDAIIFATGFDVGFDVVARTRGADLRGRQGVALAEAWADGMRTFQGWVSRGFPNLFHLGTSQNTYSVNFAHTLEEQGTHIAAVVAEAERRGDVLVEPSAAAEEAWQHTIATGAPIAEATFAFDAECTPGYYNQEGRPRRGPQFYPAGPAAFHELMDIWRRTGGMDEVLGTPARTRDGGQERA
ncbi:monooxygenase [Amycolatopsis sp. NBRC 101858]|uniref:flavin-containing monooxygenase n=1 Tax=Amycolatopsis sp. NBRC 101858 TaxID=3032200 RepID=UPI0024A3D1C9|nr:NAD(P)/FAD-dependent oxidoreductase [Amycolatopsis sp. NBRC 101858]GLY38922.1 monooxygenase [Amycolatopsis sp. NBRC 101858]